MANVCEYKAIVRGSKNACYAVFGSMSSYNNKEIVDESGTDKDYMIEFEGDCKWDVDAYCSHAKRFEPYELPEDPDEAYTFGENNWYIFQAEKPKLFGVDFQYNFADIDDWNPEEYDECGGTYYHYDSDGDLVDDECPGCLYIRPRWFQE